MLTLHRRFKVTALGGWVYIILTFINYRFHDLSTFSSCFWYNTKEFQIIYFALFLIFQLAKHFNRLVKFNADNL